MRKVSNFMPKISPDKFSPLKPIQEQRKPEGNKINKMMSEKRRQMNQAMKRNMKLV